MKRSLSLLLPLMAMLLSGCGVSDYQRVAIGDPIVPVRMHSPEETLVLTDYMPLLADEMPETMEVTDNGRIQLLLFGENEDLFNVVVLPDKPFATGLVAVSCNDHFVTIQAPQSESLQLVALIQNVAVAPEDFYDMGNGLYEIELRPKLRGRSFLRVFACDEDNVYNDVLVPLQNGEPVVNTAKLTRHDDQAQVLYSLMVDRFANGNENNDWKMHSPEVLDIVDYQGGDFAGITNKIAEGFFDELGINTIWISPITQNPWNAWGKYVFKKPNKYDPSKKYTKFSGYHGYWPIYATELEMRFGSDDEFRAMLDTAHAHNINVILDYVANHMHINSPTYRQHPDWHTDSILPDGRRNFELWDEARLTTWFDRHIPTLDLERADICEAMTDSALFWLEHFELDGFRHDACKHIPEGYWRILGQKMAKRFPDRHIWMIGETYGSPQLIGSYIKTGMLNAQFDFNVYFAIRDALVKGESFELVNNTIIESLAAYGSHHTQGNISGNHDQIRFASMAGGAIGTDTNGKEEGWTSEVGIGDATKAYTRALQQEALNLTLPGVPCIYQGDEYAEVGGNDPDNRHMMRFDGLNEQQQAFRKKVRQLIAQRRNNMALLYGDYVPVEVSKDTLIFERRYMNQVARVTIVRDQAPEIEFTLE
ncbi:MAG: hypothetical protein J5612_01425 [Paludibacteraceae bacterium]|nr:hypothetical protein [Paludibacteraceae bacterium]